MHAEMEAQLVKFESRRGVIIEEGLKDMRKAMRAEFALAKERDVATALRRARVSKIVEHYKVVCDFPKF